MDLAAIHCSTWNLKGHSHMHEITSLQSEILMFTMWKFLLWQLMSRLGRKHSRPCLCLVAALHLQPVSLPGTALSSCSSMTHHPCTFWRGQTCSCSQARQEGAHSHSKAETKEATSRHVHTDGKKLRGIASLPLILLF